MPKSAKLAVKFERVDQSRVKGRVGHSRTGACTACNHGLNYKHNKVRAKKKF
jgi:hypothetical protein